MKVNVKLYSSHLDKLKLRKAISENLLPVFLIRSIWKIGYIAQWSETPIHLKELSPSNELFWDYRDEIITEIEYQKKLLIELSNLDLQEIILRLENLKNISGASGVILFGKSGEDLIAELLWNTGNLLYKPERYYDE